MKNSSQKTLPSCQEVTHKSIPTNSIISICQMINLTANRWWTPAITSYQNTVRAGHLRGVSGVTHLPRQMVPFPTYPGLQVQLCPLTVLVQIAFSSQLCCPLPHSSCSARRGEKKERITASFSAWWWRGIWKPSGITGLPQWLTAGSLVWEPGNRPLQSRNLNSLSTVMVFRVKTREKGRIGQEAKYSHDKTPRRRSSLKNTGCEGEPSRHCPSPAAPGRTTSERPAQAVRTQLAVTAASLTRVEPPPSLIARYNFSAPFIASNPKGAPRQTSHILLSSSNSNCCPWA